MIVRFSGTSGGVRLKLIGQDGPMLSASLQFVRRAGLALVVMAGMVLFGPGVTRAWGDEPSAMAADEAAPVVKKPLFPAEFVPVPSPGAARTSGAGGESGVGLITSLAAPMAVVMGAIFVAAAVFKKLRGSSAGLVSALGAGGPAPAGLLEVIGRYPIARGQSLVVLKFDQRVLLLSHSTGTMRGRTGGAAFTVLTETAEPSEVASILLKARDAEGESIARRFETLMERYDDQATRTLRDDEPEIGRQTTTRSGSSGRVDRAELWRDDVVVAAPTAQAMTAPAERGSRTRNAVEDLQARLARMANGAAEGGR